MVSTSWNARPAGSDHLEPPSQPTFSIPYVDSNNRCDGGPPSTSPPGVLQPTPPMPEPSDLPHLSSNQLILQDQRFQPLRPRPIVQDRNSRSVAQSCGTVYLPCPPPVSWGIDQQALPDPTARIKQEVESTSPYPSATVSARQLKRVRTTAACENCRYARTRCDEDTPCVSCRTKRLECKRDDYKLKKPKSDQVDEMLPLLQKIYDTVSDLRTKFDHQQSAGSHNSPIPAHPSTEYSFYSSSRSTHMSTKASDSHSDSEDRSTPPPVPATDIPATSLGKVDREPLTTIVDDIDDEAEWDSNMIWFYIGQYYDATVYSSGIIPHEQLDRMVHQFLTDRECWAERSGTDIDAAIVFLVLAVGKLYAKRPSRSVRPGQDTQIQAHGFAYFKLGEDMFKKCSSVRGIESARANALLGLYLYQLGHFPAALGHLGAASQFAHALLGLEINQLSKMWLRNKLSREDANILMLHVACLGLESEISQTMLEGFWGASV